jgi:hypothetical protein
MPVDGDLYVLRPGGDGDDEEWVSPRPIDEVVVESLTAATDLDADDVGDLDSYVDRDDLAAHLTDETDERLSFDVEGHDVAVATDGTVEVDAD